MEKSRGTGGENEDYCKKDGEFFERGDIDREASNGQGARKDILKVKAKLDRGDHFWEIAKEDETFGTVANNWRFLQNYERSVTQHRASKTIVTVLWGDSGCGKSLGANQNKNLYSLDYGQNGVWFDGYEPNKHRTILLDEFNGNVMRITEFLKLTDRYAYMGETKGGRVVVKPKHVFITSNYAPGEWWTNVSGEQQAAVSRRITNEFLFRRNGNGDVEITVRKGTWRAFPLRRAVVVDENDNDKGLMAWEDIEQEYMQTDEEVEYDFE